MAVPAMEAPDRDRATLVVWTVIHRKQPDRHRDTQPRRSAKPEHGELHAPDSDEPYRPDGRRRLDAALSRIGQGLSKFHRH